MDKGGWETDGPRLQCPCFWDSHLTELSGLSSFLPPRAMPEPATGCRRAGARGNAGGTTHLLAFSRVSTFFHSSLFSDVNVSTLWGPSRHRLSDKPQTWLPPHFGVTWCVARRILVPNQDLNPCPLHWEHRVVTAGPPGKSLCYPLCPAPSILLPCHPRTAPKRVGEEARLGSGAQATRAGHPPQAPYFFSRHSTYSFFLRRLSWAEI